MTGVSDFGISTGGGTDEPEDQSARVRLAAAVRRLTVATVGADVSDAALLEAAEAVETATGRLVAGAGPQRPARRPPDPRRPPQDFFPTSPVIGLANPVAPPVELEVVDGSIAGTAFFDYPYEGPPLCVHGGVIALTFDEILGAAIIVAGHPGMTGTLTVRYRRPTPLRTPLTVAARYVEREGRKIRATAEIRHGPEVTAEAEGIFIELRPERFLSVVTRHANAEDRARFDADVGSLGLEPG